MADEAVPVRPTRETVFLFLAALALYVPGVVWGLPYASAPDRVSAWGSDETAPLGAIAQVLHYLHAGTQLDPRYPLLVYAVQLLFMGPYLVFLWLTDGLALGMAREYPFGLADPIGSLSSMTLIARVPSLLMAAALSPIAYLAARTSWDRRAGLLAGAFAAVLFPLFFYSRTGHVDVHAMFWIALCLLVFARYLRYGLTRRRAILIALFAALATASKDQSYAICGTACLVVVVRSAWLDRSQDRPWSHLAAALAVGVVSYSVASGLVLNPGAFLTHVDFITHGSGKGPHLYFANEATLTGYLNVLREFGGFIGAALGLPTALLAAAGLVLAAFRDRRALLLVLPVLGLLAGVVLPVRLVLFRFVLPAAWILALFAAYAARTLIPDRPKGMRTGVTFAGAAAVTLVAAGVGWSLLRGVDLTGQMLYDSRFELGDWLARNTRPGDTVGYYGAPAKLPALAPRVATVPGPHEDPDTSGDVQSWPEFIVLIPQLEIERDHEWTLSERRYAELSDGRWPYQLMLATQGRSLLSERLISGVNPRVRLFARKDVVPRLVDRDPVVEID